MKKLAQLQKTALRKVISGNGYIVNIPEATLKSLVQRKLIEQTGDWYYCLTDAGLKAYHQIEAEAGGRQ